MTAYDSGMISVADRPINQTPAHDPAHGWLGAAETMILMLSEFRRQVSAR